MANITPIKSKLNKYLEPQNVCKMKEKMGNTSTKNILNSNN